MVRNSQYASSRGQIIFLANRIPMIFVSILIMSLALLFVQMENAKRKAMEEQLLAHRFTLGYEYSKMCPFNFTYRVYFDGSVYCKHNVCKHTTKVFLGKSVKISSEFPGYDGYYKGCIEYYKGGSRRC